MEIVVNTPVEFAQRSRADYAKYGTIVKKAGITPK
jgi:hypothetical protein